jgi:M6 family metalloprotease-like protein
VKTFYEEESHGALTFTGKVSEWYSCGKSSTYYSVDNYYKNPSDPSSYVHNTSDLVIAASDWYFDNHTDDDRLNYDKDGDGYLDSVMLIYGAPDHIAAGSDDDNLWAYCFWTDENPNVTSPTANVFFWASYDFMYSSSKAYQRTGKSYYGGGDTRYCSIDTHTYIHEMGHVFGLEDYYDYSGQHNPAAGFSMQDNNVGSHDPFSSYALGWGKAYIPTETTTINLKPFQDTGEMILLSPNPDSNNSPFAEYLLLEYYTPTGLNKFDCDHKYSDAYPQGPNTQGIRLWHVDARLAKFNQYNGSLSPTTNPPSQYNKVIMINSNTYLGNGITADSGYLSPLGSEYYNLNILQMIRNTTSLSEDNYLNNNLRSNDLFKAGATFSMSTYKYQFTKTGKLNSNTNLGFTFTVNALTSDNASITVTKL